MIKPINIMFGITMVMVVFFYLPIMPIQCPELQWYAQTLKRPKLPHRTSILFEFQREDFINATKIG